MQRTAKNQFREVRGGSRQYLAAAFGLNHSASAVCDLASMRRLLAVALLLAATGIIAACSSLAVQPGPPLDTNAQWILLPVANNSESPQAAEKLEAILPTLLRIRGVNKLSVYAPAEESSAVIPVLDDKVRFNQALDWAMHREYKYGITGSVEEWHYKSGVEREPAVGLSLRVVSITTGRVLWSASGSRSGWGRATVSGTAQELLSDMLDTVDLSEAGDR